uniref:RRM domain-containing protein n=1 Tax=Alexandrium monilatum TaxID=311494 RepID=A0A7S4RD52_9DINO
MAYSMKNSLFVRNLSPEVSEATLREVFGICDEIEQITFKPYNTLSNQFFAQVDFASSKGIIEGNKLSGSCILGVPCVCSVIDPLASPASGVGEGELALGMDEAAIQAEFARRTKEAEDDQKFRTVHIAGIGMDMTYETVRTLCKNFGEVDKLRIDADDNGQKFALCEFRERGPAHVCKMQQQYLVNGRVLSFLESQSMVDECSFAERTVQFEDPYLHAIAMRSHLKEPGQMTEKLKLVRQAAEAIMPMASEGTAWGFSRDAPDGEKKKKRDKKEKKEKEGKEGKEKKNKKEKKEKKKEKKRRKLQEQLGEKAERGEERAPSGGSGNEGARRGRGGAGSAAERSGSGSPRPRRSTEGEVTANGRRRVRYKRKRRPGEKKGHHKHQRRRKGEASRSRSANKAELVDDESDGPIDLDEVEVVQGTELVIMGSASSSSSSSSSDEIEEAGSGSGGRRKGPIELDLDGVVNLDGEAAPARVEEDARSQAEEDAQSQASGESLC